MPLPEPRYVVTELEGYEITDAASFGGTRRPGVSFHVIDRHLNHRLVKTIRSEDQVRADRRFARNETKIDHARLLATMACNLLNDDNYGETP